MAVTPSLPELAKLVEALTARVTALEATAAVTVAKEAEQDISDEASGWKKWRQNRGVGR